MTPIDDDPPGLVARTVRRLLLLLYRMRGWKAAGVVPEPRRFILIAAPHTSNWDFVNFLGLTADLDWTPRTDLREGLAETYEWLCAAFAA